MKRLESNRHLVSMCILVAFAALAFGSLDDKKGSGSSSNKSQSSDKKADEPALDVSAVDLFNAYHENEVAADDKYKGKTLRVKGAIASIDKDAFDNIIVRLQTPNQFQSVMATVDDSQKSKAASLKKGAPITVVCVGGGMVIGTPSLKECTIQ